jgi:hypothetical protein
MQADLRRRGRAVARRIADAEGIVINTTDIHLPRRIGEAVERAFHGNLSEDFDRGGYFLRVNWTAGT